MNSHHWHTFVSQFQSNPSQSSGPNIEQDQVKTEPQDVQDNPMEDTST